MHLIHDFFLVEAGWCQTHVHYNIHNKSSQHIKFVSHRTDDVSTMAL